MELKKRWTDDKGVLMHGNCLERMKEIPDNSVDMCLTDPPYGTTKCKWDSVIPFAPMWEQLKRVTKKNGAVVLTASQPFTSALGASNLPMLRYSWIWRKNNITGHLNAKKMPMKEFEDVLVFYAQQPTYNPQGLQPYGKKNSRSGNGPCFGKSGLENFQEFTNYPRSILDVAYVRKRRLHPTQKPVALLEYLIKTYTNPGELVNRRFIGIEMDEEYFKIAQNRINHAS